MISASAGISRSVTSSRRETRINRNKTEFGSYHRFGCMPIAEVSVLPEFLCAP
ncbi:hypothetical protein Syncc8109_0762 [Synechococcus sp. WH 8109]|nr:hypothetical protein Syncc8109_0762 [Synechococcus sp. WH 8109]